MTILAKINSGEGYKGNPQDVVRVVLRDGTPNDGEAQYFHWDTAGNMSHDIVEWELVDEVTNE